MHSESKETDTMSDQEAIRTHLQTAEESRAESFAVHPAVVGKMEEKARLRSMRTEYDIRKDFAEAVELLYKEAHDLLLSKHRDYGAKNISQSPGGPLNGLRVRLHDKLARINNLAESDQAAQHEPLRDSLLDLANYALIGVMVLDESWPAE
jgi:hypothetical protein